MKNQSAFLQPAFRPQDLISTSSFIDFCRNNGVETTSEALLFFEYIGLLFPAVRVNRGYISYKKIFANFEGTDEWRFVHSDDLDKFTYKEVENNLFYGLGGLWLGRKDTLQWYEENDMLILPAQGGWQEEFEWPQRQASFTDDTKKLGNPYEPLYMPFQMYPLHYVQSMINPYQITFSYRKTNSWQEVKAKMLKGLSPSTLTSIQKKINEYYNFFGFFVDLLDELDYQQSKLKESVKEQSSQTEEGLEGIKREIPYMVSAINEERVPFILELAKRYHLSLEGLEEWKERFLTFGSFWSSPSERTRIYVSKLSDEDLADAEDAYKITYFLNWYLKLCGKKVLPLTKSLLKSSYKRCKYCGTPFLPRSFDNVTCGAKQCVQDHKNEWKRENRKAHRGT